MPRKDLVHSWFLDSICWMNKINSCWLWSLIAYLIAPPFTMLLQPSPSPGVCSNSCPWVGDAIETFHPLSPTFPFAFNLSQHQGLFKWVSSSDQVAKYWNFSFSISSSNEYLELISFRMDWLDLLAVQGTLKSLLQHHSSKASILPHNVLLYCWRSFGFFPIWGYYK